MGRNTPDFRTTPRPIQVGLCSWDSPQNFLFGEKKRSTTNQSLGPNGSKENLIVVLVIDRTTILSVGEVLSTLSFQSTTLMTNCLYKLRSPILPIIPKLFAFTVRQSPEVPATRINTRRPTRSHRPYSFSEPFSRHKYGLGERRKPLNGSTNIFLKDVRVYALTTRFRSLKKEV